MTFKETFSLVRMIKSMNCHSEHKGVNYVFLALWLKIGFKLD